MTEKMDDISLDDFIKSPRYYVETLKTEVIPRSDNRFFITVGQIDGIILYKDIENDKMLIIGRAYINGDTSKITVEQFPLFIRKRLSKITRQNIVMDQDSQLAEKYRHNLRKLIKSLLHINDPMTNERSEILAVQRIISIMLIAGYIISMS